MRIGVRFATSNVVVVFILVVTALVSISLFSREHQRQVTEDTRILVQQNINAIRSNMEFFHTDMGLFLVTLDLGEKLPGNINRIEFDGLLKKRFLDFFELNDGYKLYQDVVLTDAQGNALGTTSRTPRRNYRDTEWWQQAVNEGTLVTPVTYDDSTEEYGTNMTLTIRNGSGQLTGVLRAFLSMAALVQGSGLQFKQYPSTIVELADDSGQLLYSTKLYRPGENLSERPYYSKERQEGTVTIVDVEGNREIVHVQSFSPDGHAGALRWQMIMRQRYDEVLGPEVRLRRIMLLVTGLAVLLAATIALVLTRNITRRFSALQHAAQGLGSGKYSERINVEGHDELSRVSEVFNLMAENLERHSEELQQEIEERERSEAMVSQQADKLTRSNEELEQFAYVASHDLQEPLRIIVSYIQLVQRRYEDKLDEDGQRFMLAIVSGAERMRALIRGLLHYSRVNTKGNPFEAVDLEAVLEEAMENLGEALKETGGKVIHEPLPQLRGDHVQLVQLFQNLIGNALKFHREDTVPEVRITATQQQAQWQFTVSDNGIGIEKEYADRIFTLFQRLHSRAQYKGTGIGLSVCKRIVERHSGRIWLDTNCEQGTTFHFTLIG